jgi:hypothetical protein
VTILGTAGFRGVRWLPCGTSVAELTVGSARIWLRTFNSPEEAARANDTACGRFGRGREWLNFPDITSREEAKFLASPPCEDYQRHERAHLKLDIAEADERQMPEWSCYHHKDVAGENTFWAAKKAMRMERKRYIEAELAGPSTLDDDPQWEDLILATELWRGDLSSSSFFLQTMSFKIL